MHRRLVPELTPADTAWRVAASGLRRAAFWAAVALPLAYLPLLTLDGGVRAVAALVAVNVVCLFVGHDYSPQP